MGPGTVPPLAPLNPGLTFALKCRNTLKPVYCALVMDEMAVIQHVEWDGTNYHGYVNVGESICN